VSALFIETHEDPDNAPSDGPNMIPIEEMKALIGNLARYDSISKES
jgi:2-dehydro-3-deoxyphosphooctonate aldolase (KDO 8-P synthase)